MIFFTAREILISVLSAAAFGFAFGVFYTTSHAVFFSLYDVVMLFLRVIRNIGSFRAKDKHTPQKNRKASRLSCEVFDFLSFFIFGIIYLIINYLTLDGVFRIYPLIIAAAFFFMAKATVGKSTSYFYLYLFNRIYGVLYIILSLIFLPIYKLIKKIRRTVLVLISPIKNKIDKRRAKRLVGKKLAEIDQFFRKAGLTN